ncbi:TonB-dependent receptor [Limibacter armeniacum]|uniref:TonB-dependent receptor n=1 Tax=Limibacter armeniacum TaxID=466084 RepID=UPI002FE68D90
MKKSLLLGLILLIHSMAFAQDGSIFGTVQDESGKPLEFVNITIKGTSTGSTTNQDGEYKLENLSAGSYTLVASFINYLKQEKTVELSAGQALQVDFDFTESSTELQTVEITGRKSISYDNSSSFGATKTATLIKDTPQAIGFVTKEVMDDRQAYRVNDVVENISGVSQYSYYNNFTIRGFQSQQELINGLRVPTLFGPQTLTANLERVEVIKGPASAVFGNSSPGGTMNRVTKKPLEEERKAISFTTGSFNTLRSTLDFTGSLNEKKTLLYRLNVAYENADSFRDLQEFKSLMIAPSFSFIPTDKTSINFDLVITDFDGKLDRGQPIFGGTAGTNLYSTPTSFAIGATNDYHKTNVVYSTLSMNHKFADNFSFNASYMRYAYEEDLYEHRTSSNYAVDTEGNEIPTLMGMRISARLQQQINDNLSSYFVWDTQTGGIEHKVLFGYDFIQSIRPVGGSAIYTSGSSIYRTVDGGLAAYDPENPENYIMVDGLPQPNIPHFDLENPDYTIGYTSDYILNPYELPSTRYYTQGVYIQDQMKWGRLQVLLGLRQEFYTDIYNYQQNDEEETVHQKFLPRVGVVYALNKAINLYGTYTESFQPQNPTDLIATATEGSYDPSEGKMLEIGAKGTFFNDRLSATLAAYDITNTNILTTNINTGLVEQRGAERSRGIEVDVNGRIGSNLSLTANYAYNKATIEEDSDEALIGKIKENAPLHSGGGFANYAFDGRLSGLNLNVGAHFVSNRNTFDQDLQLPAYTLFDAGISYKVNKVKVALTVDNVFDKTYWVGGYSYARLFPGAPRNYLLSIGYTF